ncbi:MAG: hypothetical protein NZ521_08180, partial [Flammeovirgaceae bacterium]|nr:hypothetical protein [Flammeovirgaceae bacterium]MDW8288186.1 hypothetical protein [Flammeovirgaceae bacterium]
MSLVLRKKCACALLFLVAMMYLPVLAHCSVYAIFDDEYQNPDSLIIEAKKIAIHYPKSSLAKYMLSVAYYQKAKQIDTLAIFTKAENYIDSALFFLQASQELLTKKELKTTYSDFLYLFPQEQKKNESSLEAQYVHVKSKLAKDEELLTIFKKDLLALKENYEKTINAYISSALSYKNILAENSFADLLLSDEATFQQTTKHFSLAVYQLSSSAAIYQQLAEKLRFRPRIVKWTTIFNERRLLRVEVDSSLIASLQLYDFQEWLENIKRMRQQQIPQIKSEIKKQENLLSVLLQRSLTSQVPEEEIPTIETLAPNLKIIEPNSVVHYWWQYKIARIRLNSLFVKEKSMYDYDSKEEEVISTYHMLKSSAKECIKLLADLKTAAQYPSFKYHQEFFQEVVGKDGLNEFLKKERIDLLTKEQYCSIRIKDRLMYQQQRNRFIPRFALYKGYRIALFEQPMDAVTERG